MKEYEESCAVQQAAFSVNSNICSSTIIATSTEPIVINIVHPISNFDQSFLLLKRGGLQSPMGFALHRKQLRINPGKRQRNKNCPFCHEE
jgi:hypothetical protein